MDQVLEQDGFYVFRTSHRIYYNTEKPVPIKEMIIALQGLEGLLKALPNLVSAVTDTLIDHSEFHVSSIESGSLIEDIAIAFFFNDKASMEAFVAKMGGNKTVKAVVITAMLAALVGYGLHLASPKTAPNITATNNVIINIGAGEVNLTPESFTAIVHAAVGDRRDLAQNALKFVSPAKADPKSSVTIGDSTGKSIEIPPAAIAESPKKIELAKNERIQEFKNVVLSMRATNLDSKKTGWAGKLNNRDERLPIELDPSVSEAEIFGRSQLTVDAALIFRPTGKGRELKPAKIYIRKIVKS